jgi:hypothetical protein
MLALSWLRTLCCTVGAQQHCDVIWKDLKKNSKHPCHIHHSATVASVLILEEYHWLVHRYKACLEIG